MTALIASNAVLIVVKICGTVNFVSKKEVFYTCCKWANHYNIKSVSQLWIDVFLVRSYNLRDDILVGERGWVYLEQYLWFFIDSQFVLFFIYVFINAFSYFSNVSS